MDCCHRLVTDWDVVVPVGRIDQFLDKDVVDEHPVVIAEPEGETDNIKHHHWKQNQPDDMGCTM